MSPLKALRAAAEPLARAPCGRALSAGRAQCVWASASLGGTALSSALLGRNTTAPARSPHCTPLRMTPAGRLNTWAFLRTPQLAGRGSVAAGARQRGRKRVEQEDAELPAGEAVNWGAGDLDQSDPASGYREGSLEEEEEEKEEGEGEQQNMEMEAASGSFQSLGLDELVTVRG